MGNKQAKYEIEVEGKSCRLSEIDRGTLEVVLGMVMPSSGQPQYIRAGETILNTCWVDGDEEIKKDEKLLMAAAMAAYELVDLKTATLKKL